MSASCEILSYLVGIIIRILAQVGWARRALVLVARTDVHRANAGHVFFQIRSAFMSEVPRLSHSVPSSKHPTLRQYQISFVNL